MDPFHRRDFLRVAGVAGLAGTAKSAAAQAKIVPAPLGAGIIGTIHSHALGHLQSIRRSSLYNFVAAAEPDPNLLAKAKQDSRWAGVTWVSVEELLADQRIQMICVETDPLDSLPYALRSIEAGKHTKIDKPPGADLKALQHIFAEAERRHLLVQMGYVYRYNPAFRLAFQAIREGWLGPIRSLTCQMNDTQTAESRKRLDRYDGGLLYEICCHMIDALIWLMGEPKRVSSVLRHTEQFDDKLEDDVLAMFEFEPAVAVVKSHTRNGERYFYIFGEEGSVQIDSPDRPRVRLALSKPQGGYASGVQEVPVGRAVRYLPDIDDLSQAIAERRGIQHFTPEHDLLVQRMLLRACGLDI
jgi:predicted dehydrogenase